jgi:hypothetical protein
MVMHLPQPAACSVQLVNDVVDERKNGINAAYFEGIRQEWVNRVQAYLQHRGSPEHVPQWAAIPAPRKTSFLNLYLQPAEHSAQGQVLAVLRDHKLTLCPACGEMGTPNTLDHYLPKGIYPHFCVTPINLFPMCDACQQEKLEKTGSQAEPRFFLHPYFDVFVAEQVLNVTIEPPFSAPTFRMDVSEHLDPAQRALVVSHVRELAIEQRFAHFFKETNTRTLRLVQALRRAGIPIEATLRSFEQSHRVPTLNSWEHIYCSSVMDNPAMLDYLTNGVLPAHL